MPSFQRFARLMPPNAKRRTLLTNVLGIKATDFGDRPSLQRSLELVDVIVDERFSLKRVTHLDLCRFGGGLSASNRSNQDRFNVLLSKFLFLRRCQLFKERLRILLGDAALVLGCSVADEFRLRLDNAQRCVITT